MPYKLLPLSIAIALVSSPAIADNNVDVKLTPGPTFTTKDGRFKAKIIGFSQIEGAYHDDEKFDHPNGTSLRRARLGIKGKIDKKWGYKFIYEFGNNAKQEIQDVFLTYKVSPSTKLKVGQYKEPIGLEWQTGAPNWTFMELPLLTAITPRRSIGAGVKYQHQDFRVDLGFFGENNNKSRADEEGKSVDLHTSYRFMNQGDSHFHLGASMSYRTPDAETNALSFKSKHETATTTKPTLNSGAIKDIDNAILLGIDTLWKMDQFLIQAEYMTNNVEVNKKDDLKLKGYYVATAWMLTGESRPFHFGKYTYQKLKPNHAVGHGGNGALELAFRYDHLDLDDEHLLAGTMKKFTLGMNWYVNKSIKFSVNLSKADSNEHAAIANDETKTLALRAQFAL